VIGLYPLSTQLVTNNIIKDSVLFGNEAVREGSHLGYKLFQIKDG
jgi:hypothetical protein